MHPFYFPPSSGHVKDIMNWHQGPVSSVSNLHHQLLLGLLIHLLLFKDDAVTAEEPTTHFIPFIKNKCFTRDMVKNNPGCMRPYSVNPAVDLIPGQTRLPCDKFPGWDCVNAFNQIEKVSGASGSEPLPGGRSPGISGNKRKKQALGNKKEPHWIPSQ